MGRAFEYRRASKEARWDKMSKLFPKLGKAITIAAKEGGADPDMNPKLRTAIATAKAQNMPKDNIDAAIKRANGKDSTDIKTIFYDGKGAHGVQIIVETATDNPTRTVANIKSIFNKNGGEMLPSGSLNFMFSRKAVFSCEPYGGEADELELALIDAGLEEMESSDDELRIIGDYTAFGTLSTALEENSLVIKKGALEFLPNSTISLNDKQMSELEKLLDKLEDDDDVQAVYTNVE
ncbi:MAG: YebC/PmpR family DNA-binding transcriptional regulator [Campylobacter sp.]|uniref:YebC/PmpR family DNA-binding transcriptional regulator n=1 Tax=Campylobacter sp. TaxID=205 RepID=UPI002A82A665|nr:YebC/PmpR family DNA-binding transcriptional regulator [Campylobacter sp.]MCI7587450.1 YebC/PmpR family DNA-binding transcriptional regulator [Campylobacter sp.]MDY5114819.1 YebC/PmpR family DNA-binding transcriptional regulator [Campylobacter sp.]